ncbi:MAG: hypothetical protein K0S86_221 [Geminicoccaceae bacterium]|jgi:hypothetical protein|nr:hypothetical protein [Geminicoccaceae bacterium]
MNTTIVRALALGSAMTLAAGSGTFASVDPPKVNLIMQNTRTAPWTVVQRATVAQRSSRKIRLAGPWMDYVTSVTAKNGVSARNLVKSDKQVEMILDASATAPRGDMTLTLNISCPPIPFSDCRSSTTFPIKVFETGPIASIQPYGVVPPNTKITFQLTGEALNVAQLLPRLLKLGSAAIVSKTATTMQVVGVTPSCGYVDVALTDVADGDEHPYRHGPSMQAVLAGTICGQSLAPTSLKYTQCTPPQVWDANLKICKNP